MSTLRDRLVGGYYALVERGLGPVLKAGVSPDAITFLALAVALAAGFFFAFGLIFQGGLTLVLSGFLDTLDGSVARLTGRSSASGALLDSTLDRYAEFSVFSGLLVYYRQQWMFVFVLLALAGSVMVSYIKARAQSLGRVRTVGLMQRPERFVLLVAGSLANLPANLFFPDYPDMALSAAVILLAVLANATAIRRLVEGRRDLSPDGGAR
jgi:CDP-diacylglycerol--glycerol-3-phosphate 3-phosphatidyltransferase